MTDHNMINFEKALEAVKDAEKEFNVNVNWYPIDRDEDFCEAIEIVLPIPSHDELGHRVTQRVAKEYGVKLGHEVYIPEDMSTPLRDYHYFALKVEKIEDIKSGVSTLVKAKKTLEEKTDKLYDRLVDLGLDIKEV